MIRPYLLKVLIDLIPLSSSGAAMRPISVMDIASLVIGLLGSDTKCHVRMHERWRLRQKVSPKQCEAPLTEKKVGIWKKNFEVRGGHDKSAHNNTPTSNTFPIGL